MDAITKIRADSGDRSITEPTTKGSACSSSFSASPLSSVDSSVWSYAELFPEKKLSNLPSRRTPRSRLLTSPSGTNSLIPSSEYLGITSVFSVTQLPALLDRRVVVCLVSRSSTSKGDDQLKVSCGIPLVMELESFSQAPLRSAKKG